MLRCHGGFLTGLLWSAGKTDELYSNEPWNQKLIIYLQKTASLKQCFYLLQNIFWENRGEEERKRGEENYNLPSCLYDDIHRNIIMILTIKTCRAESADNHASSQIDSSVYLSHHLHRLGNSKLLGLLTALPAQKRIEMNISISSHSSFN